MDDTRRSRFVPPVISAICRCRSSTLCRIPACRRSRRRPLHDGKVRQLRLGQRPKPQHDPTLRHTTSSNSSNRLTYVSSSLLCTQVNIHVLFCPFHMERIYFRGLDLLPASPLEDSISSPAAKRATSSVTTRPSLGKRIAKLAGSVGERYLKEVPVAETTENLHGPQAPAQPRAASEILRAMTPEQRLIKAFELSELSKSLFIAGLR